MDQFQAEALDNRAGAIEGIAAAIRPQDHVAGLAEALAIVSDKLTDILGAIEDQKVPTFLG